AVCVHSGLARCHARVGEHGRHRRDGGHRRRRRPLPGRPCESRLTHGGARHGVAERAGSVGYRVEVSTELGPVAIGSGTEDDLAGIVEILNYTAANSYATFATRPTSVEDRREWFEQFAATGPYRLMVARRGTVVVGYACSQRYRDGEAFRETVEVS